MARLDCTGCGNDSNGKCDVLITKPIRECWARASFQEIADRYQIMADKSLNHFTKNEYLKKANQYKKLVNPEFEPKKEPKKRPKQIHTPRPLALKRIQKENDPC